MSRRRSDRPDRLPISQPVINPIPSAAATGASCSGWTGSRAPATEAMLAVGAGRTPVPGGHADTDTDASCDA